MNTSDVRFLSDPSPHPGIRVIYRYRSGYLKAPVRERILEEAEACHVMAETVVPSELSLKLLSVDGLFGETLAMCDVGTERRNAVLVEALNVIALNGRLSSFCIFVRAHDDEASSEIWTSAAANAVIIEEPRVSKSNVKEIFEFLVRRNGYDQFRNAHAVAFRILRSTLADKSWSLGEIAKLVDMTILSPTFASQLSNKRRSLRGEVLNECVMDFLEDRGHLQIRRLLQAVDVMKTEKLRTNSAILAELYSATEKAICGTDRRYRRNKQKLGPPARYISWALRLMLSERVLLTSPLVPAVERLCRDHMATDDEEWLREPSSFKNALFGGEFETALGKRRRSLFEAVVGACARSASELGSSSNVAALLSGQDVQSAASTE